MIEIPKTTSLFTLNWKIAGRADEGVMVVSKMMAKTCKRHGLKAFNYLEYLSLIKGGHQTGQVFASNDQATCQKKTLDVLVTLGKNGFVKHENEITPETLIIYNSDAGSLDKKDYEHLTKKIVEIPFRTLAKEKTGSFNAANIAVLGVSAYFLGFNRGIVRKIIEDEFAGKGEKIIEDDLIAFEAGFEVAEKQGKPLKKTPKSKDDQILLTGNEAVGMGAIAAGIQFYSAYPMTPATALLHYLTAQQANYPLIVKHAEDEIEAVKWMSLSEVGESIRQKTPQWYPRPIQILRVFKTWSTYILQCKDNTLYTGVTNDLTKRIKTHNSGKGSRYTRSHLPVKLVYFEKFSDRSTAQKREAEIKKLTREKKRELIEKYQSHFRAKMH